MTLDRENWRTPRRSVNNGACVEAASTPAGVLVRDTKDRDGYWLAVPAAAWEAFAETLKAGAA